MSVEQINVRRPRPPADYMHTPLPEDNTTLHDLGFEALPYLDVDAVSEVMVYCGFAAFFLWLFSPFATRRKSFHSVVVLKRVRRGWCRGVCGVWGVGGRGAWAPFVSIAPCSASLAAGCIPSRRP